MLYNFRLQYIGLLLHQHGQYQLLTEVMHAFHHYGFVTKVIICDGAGSNLAAIKSLTGFGGGAYGNDPLKSK